MNFVRRNIIHKKIVIATEMTTEELLDPAMKNLRQIGGHVQNVNGNGIPNPIQQRARNVVIGIVTFFY